MPCSPSSHLGDGLEDPLQDVLPTHVLGHGDVDRALLVLPRRLVHVEHLGEEGFTHDIHKD